MRKFFSSKRRPSDVEPLFSAEALTALYSVGEGDNSPVSFGFLLRQCASAIDRGRALIETRGHEIARAVAARGMSEAMLAAWGARLFIALFWVFVGVVLAREAGAGFPVRGLDAPAAMMLARVFVAAGFVGVVAAFVGGFLVRAGERAIGADAGFGAEAGAITREFSETVAQLKAHMMVSGGESDLSRLHLLAVEAAAFLDGISFLTEPDHRRADESFAAFLARHAPPAGAGGAALLLLALGALIGAVAAAGGWPRFGAAGLPLWAVVALPGAAFLYAGLGAVFSAASAASAGGSSAKARGEILTRLRRAYVEAGGVKGDALIAEIETAISWAGSASPPRSGHEGADEIADAIAEDFAWRKAPEAPRFVAQTFNAAPPVFRAETQAPFVQKNWKNFFRPRGRNADPKQSPLGPDAPPWLNH